MKQNAKKILICISVVMTMAVIFSITAFADYTGYAMLYTSFDDSHWNYTLKYASGETCGLRPYCYEDFTVVKLARYKDNVMNPDDNVLEIIPSNAPGTFIAVLCSNYDFETLASFEFSSLVVNLDLATVFGLDYNMSLLLIEVAGYMPYVTVPLNDNDFIGVFSVYEEDVIYDYEEFAYSILSDYYDYVSFYECVTYFSDYFDKDISTYQSGFNAGFEYLLANFETMTDDERVVALKQAVYQSGYLAGYTYGYSTADEAAYDYWMEDITTKLAIEWKKGYTQGNVDGKAEVKDSYFDDGWEACMKNIEKIFGEEWEGDLKVSVEELRTFYYEQGLAKGKLINAKKSFDWATAFGRIVDSVFNAIIDGYNNVFSNIKVLGYPLKELFSGVLYIAFGLIVLGFGWDVVKKIF